VSADADRIVPPGPVHYATEYSTGDQEVPTACGKTISTWAAAPDERATSHDKDTTCPTCLRHVATRLRADLDEACADPGSWRLKAVRRGLQLRIANRERDAAQAELAERERQLREWETALGDTRTALHVSEDRVHLFKAELARVQAEAAAMRKWLWVNHGCAFAALYGDDGEMQCGACGIDFNRGPIDTIGRALAARVPLLEAVATALREDRTASPRVMKALDTLDSSKPKL
jgi:hypothetical protein